MYPWLMGVGLRFAGALSGAGDANARRNLRDELQLLGVQVPADQGPPLERCFPVEDAHRGMYVYSSSATVLASNF